MRSHAKVSGHSRISQVARGVENQFPRLPFLLSLVYHARPWCCREKTQSTVQMILNFNYLETIRSLKGTLHKQVLAGRMGWSSCLTIKERK